MDAQTLFGVEGLVAVITGGGSGLGLLMANALAANGAKKIYILGRRPAPLQSAASSCPQGTLHPLICDITSKPSLLAAAATIKREVGYVNLVIANAGAYGQANFKIPKKEEGGTIKEVQEFLWGQSGEGYAAQWETNVTATLWTATAFLELLDKGNRVGYGNIKVINGENFYGAVMESSKETKCTTRPDQSLFTAATSTITSQILAISSVSGLNKNGGAGFGYCASKAAQIHLSRMLAVQLEPFGIRSNVLAPVKFGTKFPRILSPMERTGRDEEISGTVLWLAGKAGAYYNGNVVVLDGGRLLVNPNVI